MPAFGVRTLVLRSQSISLKLSCLCEQLKSVLDTNIRHPARFEVILFFGTDENNRESGEYRKCFFDRCKFDGPHTQREWQIRDE